jgi:hypothetical protein
MCPRFTVFPLGAHSRSPSDVFTAFKVLMNIFSGIVSHAAAVAAAITSSANVSAAIIPFCNFNNV